MESSWGPFQKKLPKERNYKLQYSLDQQTQAPFRLPYNIDEAIWMPKWWNEERIPTKTYESNALCKDLKTDQIAKLRCRSPRETSLEKQLHSTKLGSLPDTLRKTLAGVFPSPTSWERDLINWHRPTSKLSHNSNNYRLSPAFITIHDRPHHESQTWSSIYSKQINLRR